MDVACGESNAAKAEWALVTARATRAADDRTEVDEGQSEDCSALARQ